MYNTNNLIIYYDKDCTFKNLIHNKLCDYDIKFKELNSLKLVFSALKNPENYIIIAIEKLDTLHEVENFAKSCFDWQNRVFIIFNSSDNIDFFFHNYCNLENFNILESFLQKIDNVNLYSNHQTSELLLKLINIELQNLDISSKYAGFKYLSSIISNALTKNSYANGYIDLFTCVTKDALDTVDTIERNVRHMLKSTWKNSDKFRNIFKYTQTSTSIPNSRVLLQAIINHIKQAI